MTFGSVCSGIEAVSVAWHPLGMRAAWFAEVDPFCSALLSQRWSDVPNHGDFISIAASEPIDILVGGTPCQSFSVAGKRAGLDDARGNLAIEFLRLAGRLKPSWLVWENVPGVLSSGGGRDFGVFLGIVAELGYGFAYRVLDAQYFGVPQRRRRVFVVGHLGDWRRAAAVLFERDSLRRNSAPRRETRAEVARSLKGGARGGGGQSSSDGQETLVSHSLRAEGFDASEDGTGRGTPLVACPLTSNPYGDHESRESLLIAQTIPASNGGVSSGMHPVIPIQCNGSNVGTDLPSMRRGNGHVTGGVPVVAETLTSHWHHSHGQKAGNNVGVMNPVINRSGVRRLTPRECERLQGFPDDYTLIEYRGKPVADGPRYKALGNSMAVPCMAWIGRRIIEATS